MIPDRQRSAWQAPFFRVENEMNTTCWVDVIQELYQDSGRGEADDLFMVADEVYAAGSIR